MTKNSHTLILTEQEGPLLWITLNRPERGNAYSTPMVKELVQALQMGDQNHDVRVMILKAEGEHFCTGGDIKFMAEQSEMFAGSSLELRQQYHFGIQEIPRQIERLQKPLLSLIQGSAVGAGCDLVAMTDLRFATPEASFSESFNRVGLVPGDGGSYFLIRAIGYSRAMEMFFLGKKYSAKEAHQMGLVHAVFEAGQILNEVKKIALKIAQFPPEAVWMTKRALVQAYQDNLHHHLEMMSAYQALTQRSEDHFLSLENLKNQETRPYNGK
jgi:2-(1,2-epoxy-1,2-dihydrophenyl)acetyl-CoA isomerase